MALLADSSLSGVRGAREMTPAAHREAVAHLRSVHEMSERRACRVLGVDRTSVRYRATRPDDGVLRDRLKALAQERRRFGYRRLHVMLRREGHVVNRKRVQRLYREEKLTVRRRGGRKRAMGTRWPLDEPLVANQRWSLDFVSDQLTDGRRFRILTVIDNCTRACLSLVADISLSGRRVARELDAIIVRRGRPETIVSDNGTELTSNAILSWADETGVASGRPDGIAALIDDLAIEPVGVIGLVGENVVGGDAVDQVDGGCHVVLLTRPQQDADRQAQGVYADVDLGSEAAARPAKRLGVRSPLLRRAPAAWAWARMTVASSMTHSRSGSAATASNRRFSTLHLDPVIMSPLGRLIGTEPLRQIAPAPTRPRHPQQGAHEQATVAARTPLALATARHERLNPRPLIVPKNFAFHQRLQREALTQSRVSSGILIVTIP